MRISLLVALFVLLLPVAADAQLSMVGAGGAVATAGCSPFSYPASPAYQTLTYAGYTQTNAALATNAVISPACTTTGSTLTENNATNIHRLQGVETFSVGIQTYTLTAWAKRTTGSRNYDLEWSSSDFSTSGGDSFQNLATCAITLVSLSGNYTLISDTGTPVGGWCKTVVVFTNSATDTGMVFYAYMISGATTSNYAGDGSSAIGVWGLDIR